MPSPAQMLLRRKLGPQVQGGIDRPGRDTADLATDLSPANIQALAQAIDQARDPRTKALLMQELERLKETASNLLGPVQAPQEGLIPPQEVQRMPYDPASQQPGVWGGTRIQPAPYMDQNSGRTLHSLPPPIIGVRG